MGAGSDFLLDSHPPTVSIPVLIPCSAPTAVIEARDGNAALGARTKPKGCLSVIVLDPRPGIPTMLVRIVYVAVVEVPRTTAVKIERNVERKCRRERWKNKFQVTFSIMKAVFFGKKYQRTK